MRGKIISVNISREKGTSKKPEKEAYLKKGYGIIGDAHAGQEYRQVSLLSQESVRRFSLRKKISKEFRPGDFAENITIDIDLSSLKIENCLKLGEDAIVKVTQIGKKFHNNIFRDKSPMFKEGIFVKVIREGKIQIGDNIEVINDKDRDNYSK